MRPIELLELLDARICIDDPPEIQVVVHHPTDDKLVALSEVRDIEITENAVLIHITSPI